MSDEATAAGAEPAADDSVDPFTGPAWIGKYNLRGGGSGRVRMSDGRRARRRLQRRTGWFLLSLGGLIVATAAWLAVTGLMARHDLNAMKTELDQLRHDISTGNVPDAKVVAADLARHAHHAHTLTSGPAWWAAAELPMVGDPLKTARGISAAADALGSRTVPQLIDISVSLDPSRLRLDDHKIDISSLVQVTPQIDAAVENADQQQGRIAALPRDTWLTPMNTGAAEVSAALSKLVGSLDTIEQAVQAAPILLGYPTPQRYFVGFQNEAEARGTGGLPGAFAIVVADRGTLTFTHFGNDSELEGIDSGLDFGPAYNQTWHDFEPTRQYLNSDVDPDFRYAGQIWATMWQKKSGEHINGAISLDPTALSYFLAVTGPAELPDGTQITSTNIVALTQSTVYARFTDQTVRKAYLLEIASAADRRILDGHADPSELLHAASKAAAQRRLLIWSENQQVESVLDAETIGGTVSDTASPYMGLTLINFASNKLDYYLETTVNWKTTGCGVERRVTVTISLTNTAPGNLSSYVSQRLDKPSYRTQSGDNRVLLHYTGTHGGNLDGISVDGKAGTVQTGTEQGHPTYSTLVEVPRGESTTVTINLDEPGNSTAPLLVTQPSVTPIALSTDNVICE